MFDPDDYESLKGDEPYTTTVYQLQEKFIKRALFKELKQANKNTVAILEWNGRKEKRKTQHKVHNSPFLSNYDLATFERVSDKSLSPFLIGYEVKGVHKIKKKNGKFGWRKPRIHAGIGQAVTHVEQDANQSYVVTIRRTNDAENEHLKNIIERQKYLGLIFASVNKGRLKFDYIVKPKEYVKSPNQDRKKSNLVIVSVWERPCCKDIRRKEWARNAEF